MKAGDIIAFDYGTCTHEGRILKIQDNSAYVELIRAELPWSNGHRMLLKPYHLKEAVVLDTEPLVTPQSTLRAPRKYFTWLKKMLFKLP